MDNIGTWLEVALGLVALASLSGYGWNRARIQQLEQRAISAEREEAALNGRLAAVQTDLTACQVDLKALSRVVTNETYIVSLTQQIEDLAQRLAEYHRVNEAHWEDAMTVWRDLLDAYRGPQ